MSISTDDLHAHASDVAITKEEITVHLAGGINADNLPEIDGSLAPEGIPAHEFDRF